MTTAAAFIACVVAAFFAGIHTHKQWLKIDQEIARFSLD